MNDSIETRAKSVASRVPPTVGIDPVTILTILTTVLPLLMKCFQRNDEPNPAAMRANIKGQHERAPEQLRRRTARRIRGEADEPMTKAQSFTLADAVIAEACEADETAVASFAAACQDGA